MRGDVWGNMNNEEGGNMDFGAERHTVVQILVSRGSVAERILHQTSTNKNMTNKIKNHPKSMKMQQHVMCDSCLTKDWNYTEALEAMASIALVLALVPLQKVSHRFSNGRALCKVKMTFPSQR